MSPIIAKRIAKSRLRHGTGLETIIDFAALGSLIIGALIAIFPFMTFQLEGFLASVGVLLGACLHWLLLRSLADHLRLQKKIAGCNFEGSISGKQLETIWTCGHCGQMLHADHRCDGCGAQIEMEET